MLSGIGVIVGGASVFLFYFGFNMLGKVINIVAVCMVAIGFVWEFKGKGYILNLFKRLKS